MTIYTIEAGLMRALNKTRYEDAGIKERMHLQTMLKKDINALFRDTPEYQVMVVSEEFCEWDGSRRSIDLLGLDNEANLVVIELKRTEDGAHMELQALRYAAMVSSMTFDRLVDIYARYLVRESGGTRGHDPEDARQQLLDFLAWPKPDESRFAQEVKIVLASAGFSSELTTAVMWLNDKYGLDIRCIRMVPYDQDGGKVLIDIHTFIPVAEAQDYLANAKVKEDRERTQRASQRDYTKYDVVVNGHRHSSLAKRNVVYHLMKGAHEADHRIERLMKTAPHRNLRLFRDLDGELTGAEVEATLTDEAQGGKPGMVRRYFTGDGELFHEDGKTYVLSNQWGGEEFDNTVAALKELLGSAVTVEVAGTVEGKAT